MASELGCSVIAPLPPHPHTHTVVFLHGRGDTARNAADALLSRWARGSRGRSLVDCFPSVRWVFPQAEPLPAVSHAGELWDQWFDVPNVLDPTDREDLQVWGLRDSVDALRKVVRKEAETVGGLERVLLMGISQGGATAVHVLLQLGEPGTGSLGDWDWGLDVKAKIEAQHLETVSEKTEPEEPPERLGGLLAFASWLPLPGGSLDETREVLGLDGGPPDNDYLVQNTPVFLGHCADDPLVFVEFGRQLRDGLRGFGMTVDWNEYPDGGHWINAPQGIDDMVTFMKAQGIPVEDEE
ncbi:alpha/beta-hydrolase [Hypomontagnella monticulosa]|nr:alpha/beta-hydrolase [Hypomontagnella monticulosa]